MDENNHEKSVTSAVPLDELVSHNVFVVVADNDQTHLVGKKEFQDDGGPLIFEQYVRTADYKSMLKRKATLEKRYGKCRLARLQFIDEHEFTEGVCL